jgi:hypothetical protein
VRGFSFLKIMMLFLNLGKSLVSARWMQFFEDELAQKLAASHPLYGRSASAGWWYLRAGSLDIYQGATGVVGLAMTR